MLGFEVDDDSIFYIMLRIPNYMLIFMWPLYAERGGSAEIRKQFDKRFQRPFRIYFWLIIVSVCAFTAAVILQKYYFQPT